MEMWTLINKNTKQLIRCGHAETGDDQGDRYFFSEVIYYPYWFVESEELAKKSLMDLEKIVLFEKINSAEKSFFKKN